MRILLISLLFLVSCNKKHEIVSIEKEYFYRVAEVTLDGKTTFTPIKRISVEQFLYQKNPVVIQNSDGEDSGEDEEDEDEDEDGDNSPCPIDITTYTVSQYNDKIKIQWKSLNEEKTSFYRIERSDDLKKWDRRTVIMPNDQGFYLYYDNE
jgi:hypothetical protein